LGTVAPERLARRRRYTSVAFALAAYFIASYLVFGRGLAAADTFLHLLFMPSSIGKPAIVAWICAPIALAISIYAARQARRYGLTTILFVPSIVFLWIVLTALMAGMILEGWKTYAVNGFEADRQYTRPAFASYHHARSPGSRRLHGAALKDCQAYLWSYREMTFRAIGPDTAVNVLPGEWVAECGIKRT